MQVALVGHSFIRRLRDFLLHRGQSPSGLQLGPHYQVKFYGTGGAMLAGKKSQVFSQKLQAATLSGPHVVYIAMGTNDLSVGKSPHTVANMLFSLAMHILDTSNTRLVIIEQILPRHPGLYPAFTTLMSQTNTIIQELITSANNPAIKFWKHRRFFHPQHPLLAQDGVHLNNTGMAKYWRSIRGAIIWANKHIQ